MAEFAEHGAEFRADGMRLAALAVDPPDRSEPVRLRYGLQFPILCDTERRVAREWSLLNPEERGGIAVPAIFLLDPSLRVLYVSEGTVVSRVRASDLLTFVRESPTASGPQASQPRRNRIVFPRLREWVGTLTDVLRDRLRRRRE